MAYGDRWFGEKKSGAEKSIAKWEKWYKDDPEFLRKLVEHSLKDTHSPGRKAAFQEWLVQRCETCQATEGLGWYGNIFGGKDELLCFECAEEGRPV